jgi:FlaA1/EpsC-like NDP-sugar epimerase
MFFVSNLNLSLMFKISRPLKSLLVFIIDIVFCVLSVWISFFLSLGQIHTNQFDIFSSITLVTYLSIGLALPVFYVFGFYKIIYRYTGIETAITIAKAMLAYLLFFIFIIYLTRLNGVPFTIGLIDPMVLFYFIGGSRIFARCVMSEMQKSSKSGNNQKNVLIYGAGSAGRQLSAAILNGHELNLVGFLDDNSQLHGHFINGLSIFDPAKLDIVIKEYKVTELLLAIPSITGQRRNQILDKLSQHQIKVLTLPGLSDIASGRITLKDVLELDVDDLLGREVITPFESLLNKNVYQKAVLVTGAGGSIGSELCRQIVRLNPTFLLVLDNSEVALYQIHTELEIYLNKFKSSLNHDQYLVLPRIIPLVGSVIDEARIDAIIRTWKPDTVYHAAAYKHVPMVEENVVEGLRNNVWGTWVCANASLNHGVSNFVLISTDKAVRPTNIMGASKRLAELLLQALASDVGNNENISGHQSIPTIFSMVRFGNVLGSSGSVVPLFKEQIKNGGPITLTDINVTRYFMSIPEAAQLVLQAGSMSSGGEVFVLDMGQPVRIYDLAIRMVELSGLKIKTEEDPDGDIEVKVIGLRSGEKLYEELLIGNDPSPTVHPRILKAKEHYVQLNEIKQKLNEINRLMACNDILSIQKILSQLVEGYSANNDIVDHIFVNSH